MFDENIQKKSFIISETKERKVWLWFRWKRTWIDNIDNYFNEIKSMKSYDLLGKTTESFEKAVFKKGNNFKQIRGSYLPQMATKAIENNKKLKKPLTNHTAVEKFLLKFDPNSFASEIPIWSQEYGYFGSIDIIRILDPANEVIEILDYKSHGNTSNVDNQLKKYKLALIERTNHNPDKIKLGYFTDSHYFRFKEE